MAHRLPTSSSVIQISDEAVEGGRMRIGRIKPNHMSHHKHPHAPVPPANQSQMGPGKSGQQQAEDAAREAVSTGTGFSEQDPQRRLGNFEGAGEHAIQQPGGRNDSEGKPTSGSDK